MRIASAASITSNPSDVEVSVDEPLSPPAFKEPEPMDVAGSDFGSVLASMLAIDAVDIVRLSVASVFCSSLDCEMSAAASLRRSAWSSEVVEFDSGCGGFHEIISCISSLRVVSSLVNDGSATEGAIVVVVVVASARFKLGDGSGEGSAIVGEPCARFRNSTCCNCACCSMTGNS